MTSRNDSTLWTSAMVVGVAMIILGLLLATSANSYTMVLLGCAVALSGTALGAVGSKKIRR